MVTHCCMTFGETDSVLTVFMADGSSVQVRLPGSKLIWIFKEC